MRQNSTQDVTARDDDGSAYCVQSIQADPAWSAYPFHTYPTLSLLRDGRLENGSIY